MNRREAINVARITRWSQRSSGIVRACGLDLVARVRERDRKHGSHHARVDRTRRHRQQLTGTMIQEGVKLNNEGTRCFYTHPF